MHGLQVQPSLCVPGLSRHLIGLLEVSKEFRQSRRPTTLKVNVLGMCNQERRFVSAEPKRDDESRIAKLPRGVRGNLYLISDALFVYRNLVGDEQYFARPVPYCVFQFSLPVLPSTEAEHTSPNLIASSGELSSDPNRESVIFRVRMTDKHYVAIIHVETCSPRARTLGCMSLLIGN